MKAIIEVDVPDYQIGQEASIYFKDTMMIKEIVQAQKTGHWEWLTEDKYRCSNCNSETRVDECMSEPMYSFCPFCGADMRGTELST